MRRLCRDAANRVSELRHIDMARVAVGFRQTRMAAGHGLYASLTPLRFSGGEDHIVRRGRRCCIQRVRDEAGREMLYILNFYLPRFLDLAFREKIVTVFHELWHIGPNFDGDLRRFEGRCYAHSGSQKSYDTQVAALAERWLSLDPPEPVYGFLQHDFRGLTEQFGEIRGRRFAAPKIVPIDSV
ncbi:MAG: hypothetical protein GXY83_16555 [Rhodopirellula sp.]|nr:hypothetical protein [Rhodopirellula sp.]